MVELLYKELTYAVIGAAIEVHNVLGPGFLESVYQTALSYELEIRGLPFHEQYRLQVGYKDIIAGEYRADFIVDNKVIPSTGSGQASKSKLSANSTKSMRLSSSTT